MMVMLRLPPHSETEGHARHRRLVDAARLGDLLLSFAALLEHRLDLLACTVGDHAPAALAALLARRHRQRVERQNLLPATRGALRLVDFVDCLTLHLSAQYGPREGNPMDDVGLLRRIAQDRARDLREQRLDRAREGFPDD